MRGYPRDLSLRKPKGIHKETPGKEICKEGLVMAKGAGLKLNLSFDSSKLDDMRNPVA
jgi:hypothetical protein